MPEITADRFRGRPRSQFSHSRLAIVKTNYEEQAIQRKMALTSGIGSPKIDRNSIEDMDAARTELAELAKSHVGAIRRVCEATDLPRNTYSTTPWPSHLYFEDINSQSSFELIEVILNEVINSVPFEKRA